MLCGLLWGPRQLPIYQPGHSDTADLTATVGYAYGEVEPDSTIIEDYLNIA